MDRCAWARKVESRISRSSSCKMSGQKAMAINNVTYILDSISQANNSRCKVEDVRDYGENGGARRMKIVVKKQDLKQILDVLMREAAADSNHKSTMRNSHVPAPTTTLEQRLRKRQLLRKASQVVKMRNNNASAAAASWRPALQSIPEEEI